MKFSKLFSLAALSTALLCQAAGASTVLQTTTPVATGLNTFGTFNVGAPTAHSLFTIVYDAANGTDALTSFDLYKVGSTLATNPDTVDAQDWYQVSEFYNLDAGSYFFKAGVQGAGTISITADANIGVIPVITITPVPEPGSLALALAGVGIGGTLLRRRKAA